MSDTRSGGDEALPWLEAVEDEDEPPAVSARKMLAALALVVLGVAIVAGTLFWLGRQDTGTGPPQLIGAEPGPYKVRPEDPGGLDVAGDSGTATSIRMLRCTHPSIRRALNHGSASSPTASFASAFTRASSLSM